MDINTAILIIIGALVLFILWRQRASSEKPKEGELIMLQNHIQELNRTLDIKLSDSTKALRQQSSEMFKSVKELTEQLTRVDEGQKQVSKFADQLKNLQDILKNPKQRGVFGEYYLESLLKNAFSPAQYQMQYSFKDGTIVDAALFFGDKIIPIDSKFSLENYNRIAEESDPAIRGGLEKEFKNDLKKRIDETAKYIRPSEGTMEFAFMFIPAEGIYYDLLVNKVGTIKVNTRDLIDYAINEKKVHIVSPTTFYVTLQSMISGMKAYQIQESTEEILKNIGKLDRHLNAYATAHEKVGTHLGTVVNAYNKSQKEFKMIDKDILKLIGGEESGIKPEMLDRPHPVDDVD